MKKTYIAALVLMLMLAMLCTACGGSDNTAKESATAAPEETEIPSITAPPAGEGDGQEAGLAADDNAAPAQKASGDALANMSEEQRKAEDLIGSPVEDLYNAIGEPSEISAYTTSCMMPDAEDAVLTYNGFYVSVTRTASGETYVMGTYND